MVVFRSPRFWDGSFKNRPILERGPEAGRPLCWGGGGWEAGMARRLDCGFRGSQSWAEERGEQAEVRQEKVAGGPKEDGGGEGHECVMPMGGCVVPALGVGRPRAGFRTASAGWGQHPPSSCRVQGRVKEIPPNPSFHAAGLGLSLPRRRQQGGGGGRLCSVFSSLCCHLPALRMDGAD